MPTSIITKWVQHQLKKSTPPKTQDLFSLIAPLHLLYCFVHLISLLTSLVSISSFLTKSLAPQLTSYLLVRPRSSDSIFAAFYIRDNGTIDRSFFTSDVTPTTQG